MHVLRTVAMSAAVAALLSVPVATPAGAQGGSACTGRTGGTGTGGTQQGGARQSGGQALGGLIDVAVQNANALNNISADLLNNSNVQVVCLNDVLNGNQTNVLSDILNNSQVLSNNRDVLTNLFQNFLNNNNIANGVQVLAVNTGNTRVGDVQPRLLGAEAQTGAPTVYLFNPQNRGDDDRGGNNRGPRSDDDRGGPGNGNSGRRD